MTIANSILKKASTCLGALCGTTALATLAVSTAPTAAYAAAPACSLGNGIQHVIYIQFDNTHLLRDNPNVPSDLEQMPHLKNFLQSKGTLLNNDHTILISHTAGGILSTMTGVYPDRHGQIVSNSNVRISSTGSFSFPSSFGYWTDPVASNTTIPNMVGPDGTNIPAPWVAFTRAGCNVGGVGSANIVLENTSTGANGDVFKVFGPGSPQFAEAQASFAAPSGTAARNKAQTDFVGLAIHCAAGDAVCANGQNDVLPAEPGGYNGFKGLFGAQAINPVVAGGPVLKDLVGNPIADQFGQPGFPGFDGMFASVSLAYVAAMQEHGVPVTYAYISDAHDGHGVAGEVHNAFGPGDAGYEQQLKEYDNAFAAFFARLKTDGIDETNTLFVVTVDEGDHFVGVQKTGCDGINTPCVYGPGEVGEIQANIDTLVSNQFAGLNTNFLAGGAPYAFTVHGDDAPTFYLAKRGVGPLGQTDPVTRDFERNMANLTAVNPRTGNTDHLMEFMTDNVGAKAQHMFTSGDPARNPTFTFFGDPNYFITDFPSNTCETCIGPGFAWNHGDIQTEIGQTWVGYVGPGIHKKSINTVWTDHTDVRPTMFALLGLTDPYIRDGRTVVEVIDQNHIPAGLHTHLGTVKKLGEIYKQINAPFGPFSLNAADISTVALTSGSAADDGLYTSIEQKLSDLTTERDGLATQMKTMLEGAAAGTPINPAKASKLIAQGSDLLVRIRALAANPQ